MTLSQIFYPSSSSSDPHATCTIVEANKPAPAILDSPPQVTEPLQDLRLENYLTQMHRSRHLEITSNLTYPISTATFERIATAFCSVKVPSLIINISNLEGIKDAEFETISPDFFSEKIHILTLSNLSLGDRSFIHICNNLSRMENCVGLNLKKNNITKAGVESVFETLGNLDTQLKSPLTIDLQSNNIQDKEELKILASKLQKITIRF